MLKIIPMPSLFSLISESYSMTNLGKILIGSTVAQAALNAYQNTNTTRNVNSNPVQETWALYGQVLQTINNKPNLTSWWNGLCTKNKKNAIIEVFCKEGKGHLIPFLQQHVFPTF